MFFTGNYLILVVVPDFGFWLQLCSKTHAEHFMNRHTGHNIRGPGKNELVIKISNNFNFDNVENSILRGGHVPALIETGNRVFLYFQWFPAGEGSEKWYDHIGESVSENSGSSWSDRKGVNITGIPESVLGGYARPMDPSAGHLPGGRIRLYFTLEKRQPHDGVIGDAKIYSAISPDGINFVFESSIRFETDQVDLRDPAVVYFKSKWHLYVPDQWHQGTSYYANSFDGLNFSRQNGVSISERGNWLGSATTSEGHIYFLGLCGKHIHQMVLIGIAIGHGDLVLTLQLYVLKMVHRWQLLFDA